MTKSSEWLAVRPMLLAFMFPASTVAKRRYVTREYATRRSVTRGLSDHYEFASHAPGASCSSLRLGRFQSDSMHTSPVDEARTPHAQNRSRTRMERPGSRIYACACIRKSTRVVPPHSNGGEWPGAHPKFATGIFVCRCVLGQFDSDSNDACMAMPRSLASAMRR